MVKIKKKTNFIFIPILADLCALRCRLKIQILYEIPYVQINFPLHNKFLWIYKFTKTRKREMNIAKTLINRYN